MNIFDLKSMLDLSPHYFGMTKQFREKNPNTEIGSPGRFQVVRSELNLVSHEL